MNVYLLLGSNLGDRRELLGRAVARLRDGGLDIRRLSPVVETPAYLPDRVQPQADWNRPFLNAVVEARAAGGDPTRWRALGKTVERELGRDPQAPRWAPRPIDVDLLLWGDGGELDDDARDALTRQPFQLVPLLHLLPDLVLPRLGRRTLLDHARQLRYSLPLWMGIINVTPDSFSDGGDYLDWPQIETLVEQMDAAGAQLLDIGAESTRPGAEPLSAEQEWSRLAPPLRRLLDKFAERPFRPLLSVDTYHPQTAARAIDLGVDMINDVGGLSDPAMCELAAAHRSVQWVAMHQLSIPADSAVTLPVGADPLDAVRRWLDQAGERWQRCGIDTARLIVDPGIGFGKDGLQSLRLLQRASALRERGLRLLIGHSRKSYMRHHSGLDRDEKDSVTIGASLALCESGVDILRVHNVPAHVAAYRGWSHLRAGADRA